MYKLAQIFESADSFQDYTAKYNARLSAIMRDLDRDTFARCVEAIDTASREKKKIYIIANGGSAAAASHLVNDLVVGSYVAGQPAFRAFALTDNVESVTAISNDSGYENIFLSQLRVHLDPGDVVLAMSVSGNSRNLADALQWAREQDAVTIGWCGFEGGKLKERCDIALHLPATPDEYGPIEDAFVILGHIMTGYLAMQRGARLHH
jgi:D-sedoheptulose 7-phosphate isomerase